MVALERDGAPRRGRAGRLLGRDARGGSATRSRPTATRCCGDDLFAGEAIARRLDALGRAAGREDGARRRSCTTGSARRVGRPLWQLLGTDRVTPPTSYTIGIDTVEGTADRARRAAGYDVLKVKVGGPGDLERLRAVRAGIGGADPDRRQRGLGSRHRARAHAGAAGARRRVRRAAVPGRRPRQLPRLPRGSGPRLPVLIDEGCKDLALGRRRSRGTRTGS